MQVQLLEGPLPEYLNDMMGLGVLTDEEINALAKELAQKSRVLQLSARDLADLLRVMDEPDRAKVAAAIVANGGDATIVVDAIKRIGNPGRFAFWALASTASGVASAYHGYKRNQSVGWALWWGFMGSMFPIITPTIALAQGFGKREK